jgi:hypothetical protein
MFRRQKRKDAHDHTGEVRATEAIVTAATEPVLPPPPAPPSPLDPALATPAPAPAPAPMPAPPAPAPPRAADPAPPTASSELSSADIRARTLLADSIARMELQLSLPEPAPASLAPMPAVPVAGNGAIEALAESVARTASEVARALEQMSGMCAMLAERLDADREERRVLREAIAKLGVEPGAPLDAPSNVLGGTIYAATSAPVDDVISIVDEPRELAADPSSAASMFAAPPVAREREALFVDDDEADDADRAPSTSMFASPPIARDDEISIVEHREISIIEHEEISIIEDEPVMSTAEEPIGAGMWCREDDQWIGGVEIADFVSDNGTIRYWLRRTSDGRMLPRPFDATDLRFVRETSAAD